jgi:hypothetical protein
MVEIPKPPPPELPGGFRFTGMTEVPAGEIPEQIRAAGPKNAHRARYEGPAPLTVTIYQMNTGPSAFELVQKWRPAAGLIYFHSDSRFVTIESAGLDNERLNEVAKAFEAHLR